MLNYSISTKPVLVYFDARRCFRWAGDRREDYQGHADEKIKGYCVRRVRKAGKMKLPRNCIGMCPRQQQTTTKYGSCVHCPVYCSTRTWCTCCELNFSQAVRAMQVLCAQKSVLTKMGVHRRIACSQSPSQDRSSADSRSSFSHHRLRRILLPDKLPWEYVVPVS